LVGLSRQRANQALKRLSARGLIRVDRRGLQYWTCTVSSISKAERSNRLRFAAAHIRREWGQVRRWSRTPDLRTIWLHASTLRFCRPSPSIAFEAARTGG
jgi:hypothetical protein